MNLPLFRKTVKFEVAKDAEKPKEEAKASSEPKKGSKPEPATEKLEWWLEFEALRGEWRKALEGSYSAFPNVLKLQQDGMDRYFYILQDLGQKAEPGKTAREMRLLRDDFEVFNVQQTVHFDRGNITNIEVRFERLGPQKIGLNADKVMMLVKEVIGGGTPLSL